MPVAGLTSSLTSLIGNHGIYAVFGLMAIDAVFPAASELVLAYAGALASGAFAGQHVDLFGSRISSARLGVRRDGARRDARLSRRLDRRLGASASTVGARCSNARGRWLHLGPEQLDRAERWFDRWDDLAVLIGRITPVIRSFISIPAGVFRMPFWRYTVLTLIGFADLGLRAGRSRLRARQQLRAISTSDFRFVDYAIVAAVVGLVALFVAARETVFYTFQACDRSLSLT